MFRPTAWVIAGAAVLATAGVAHAQDRPLAPAPAAGAEDSAAAPWYQRFTTSSGVTESITGEHENDRAFAPAWTLNQRWGVTVDVREAQRIERSPELAHGNETSVGAYYQFTPSVRVGGEVSVETTDQLPLAADERDEPRAGVRIESAFRF